MAESAIHLRPCAPNYIPLDTDHSVPAGVEDNREDDNGDDFDVFRIPEDRKLGVMSTALLIVNRMVGTGIFSNPASVIKGTKSVGASLIFWVLGALMTLAGLFMYLEFGTALPRSGGEKVYLERVYRKPAYLATCMFAVQFVLFAVSTANSVSFSSYVLVAAASNTEIDSAKVGSWTNRGISVGIVTVVSCIHAFMPHTGIYIGNVLGAFKLLLLLFVICSGFAALAGHRELDPRNFSSFDGGTLADPDADTSATAAGYANALLQVLYSYSGWENANYVLTEVRNPERTLKRAAPIATIIVMTFYVLANIAYFAVFQRDTMSEEGIVLAPDFFKSVYGDNTFTSKVMPAFLSISAMGNIFAQIFAMPRVKQELAKQGILPFSRFFSSDWPSQAPSTAILLHWFFSVVLILGLSKPDTYTFMTNIFTYSDNWIKLFLAIGLLYLTWTPSEEWAKSRTTFRNYPPVTMFYVLSLLFTLGVPFVPNKDLGEIPYWVVPTLGTGMLFVGAAYWLVWAKVMPLLGYHVQHEIEVMHDGSERVRYHFETKS
ncbi:High-affinity methionine permease [Ceratocystis lukuohia]|uniref:High-affinity methionine permease n=1 Tax=Ceratocystis lukuohia TaxID=2019550 RepID=A0ABR4MEB5_9PEZI